MALIDRGSLPSNISIKGLIYSALLLLLVISLFFIPELVQFQEKLSRRKQATQFSSAGEVDIDSLLSASKSGKSLDSILSSIESGKTGAVESAPGTEQLSLSAPSASNKLSESASLQAIQDRVFLEKTLSSGQVTWDQLNSSDVKKAFRNAQTEASKLLRNLPERQTSIRFALINYINGLGWMVRADKKLMSAEEALAYIEQLDINVSQAMLTSEIDAGDFETWKKISFGPLSVNSRASAFKVGAYLAFNPRLTLTDVQIQKSPDYVKRSGVWKTNAEFHSSVKIAGFILGRDTRKITVMKNGRRVGEIRVTARPTADGLRPFSFRWRDANGVLTLRAYSKEGQAFEKSYAFLPRVYRKFRQDEQGFYVLPFGTHQAEDINLQSFDPRLDRFFRVGRAGSDSSGGQGFETF